MQANFKYLRTSKDRTHMDPLRTRDKGVGKWVGLRPPPPPNPPAFFNTMQAGFQENHTINKNCVKHVVVMAFKSSYRQFVCKRGFCKWGRAAPSPTPPLVFTPCRQVFKNPEPVIKMFADGGGAPPNPSLFPWAMQAVFQENRTMAFF